MAHSQDIENGENEAVRAPLLAAEEKASNNNEGSKEDRRMVYFTTFVAVCGSYAFGSCVCSKTLLISSSLKLSFSVDSFISECGKV